jgi:2-polyprenyl-3-methyl-5-hydroxy-6-metoxy-1,4-benzoquinol methylase
LTDTIKNFIDTTGFETLEAINSAKRFNRWMFETVRSYISGDILEIGSGIGNISELCLKEGLNLSLSDVDPAYLAILASKFSHYANLKGLFSLDLEQQNFAQNHFQLKECFDTIFMLNVLEHIQKDNEAIQNCKFMVKKNGTLLILVPAFPILYSSFDRKIGHYRRYTFRSLMNLFPESDFTIKACFYFNALGILGWVWNKILNKEALTVSKMKLFNKMVPLAKALDSVCTRSFGLSIILVAEKN